MLFLHLWWSGVLVGVHVWLARPPRGQALRFKVFARNIVMTLIIEVIMIITNVTMTHIINVIMIMVNVIMTILVNVMVRSPEWEVWGWGGGRPTQGGKPKGKWWRWGDAWGTEKEKFEMFSPKLCLYFVRSRRWIIYAFQFLLWQCGAVRGLWLRESRPKARKKVWNRALKELLWYSASNDTIKRNAAFSRMVEWLNGQLA